MFFYETLGNMCFDLKGNQNKRYQLFDVSIL